MNKKTDSQKNQRIQVFARCRPPNTYDLKPVVEVIPDKKIVVKGQKDYHFDKVFPPNTKQIDVYKAVVGPLIQEVLMGYNCTVFAYGQTGTGKTYTMEGKRSNSNCSWEDDPGAGIIPRSLHQLFEDLNKEENIEFSVRVSFLELYNEELFDLLSSTEITKLRLFEDSAKKGSVIIQGLEEIIVNTKDEVYSILEKGTARRQTAATELNATSSRSHTVFSVTVHIKENTIEGEELLKTGKLNLVDLAGSENVGRSGAVDKRAREAGNINQSLLTLGRVITALIEKQPHVPYRESKLTRLLQDSLGGHTKTSIIATISPELCNLDETISTLDYANKAKNITIKPEVNQKMTKRALIREYTDEIERLRKDLVALRNKEGFYIAMDNYTALMSEIEQKKDLISDLEEKIELLKEENAKIEEMFNITKEELMSTSEKLCETSQKYEETALKLSNTTSALIHTQKALSETALERDEKQLLLNVQCKTEKVLSQQAQKLLQVAEETTSDVNKLHAKIDRKNTVETTNEEKCKEFRTMYQKQFAQLDDLVSNSEKQQSANLSKTKDNIDEIFRFLQTHHTKTTDYLNQFFNLFCDNMTKVSETFTSELKSETEWTNSLLKDLSVKKQMLLNKQSAFLLEKLPEFIQELLERNSEIEGWIINAHTQLSEKIEKEKEYLSEKSAERREIQSSLKQSLDLICDDYEKIVDSFQKQTSNLSTQENQLEKDFQEKLNDLKQCVLSFERIAESRKELRRNTFKMENTLTENLQSNTSKLREMQKPLEKLSNYECSVEEDKKALNSLLDAVNKDEFFIKQESLKVSQNRMTAAFESFVKDIEKDEESIFTKTANEVEHHLSLVSQNGQKMNDSLSAINLNLENQIEKGKESLSENFAEIQTVVQKVKNNVEQSQKVFCSTASELKEEILKRDMEFEKFITEDLLKDIPTGTTPQRKSYSYPRLLVATSPHERILERYRKELAANTDLAINLPLNSSFNELDEDKHLSLNKSCDSGDVHNASFSSSDCDTDSYASSVSDASLDNGKNKENKRNLKKKSRLPTRLPKKGGFLKPAPPTDRKPLVMANSTAPGSYDM